MAKYIAYELEILWESYQEDFRSLGLDIKSYGAIENVSSSNVPPFQICINLQDIADLPLDKERLKIVTEEEIELENEIGEERD